MARQNIFFLVAALLLEISPLSAAQTPISPQKAQIASAKFVEVEILLSDDFKLADISTLPKAPGSDLEVLDNGERIRVQMPASAVETLLDEDAEITVLRNFVLVKSSQGGYAGDIGTKDIQPCPGPHSDGENFTDIPIPDYLGSGDPIGVCSPIPISDAPADATVTCVQLGFRLCHEWLGDLTLGLTYIDGSRFLMFYNREHADGGCFEGTVSIPDAFDGHSVNQTWLFCATDFDPSATGWIESWWIKVYYDVQEVPEPCSGAFRFGKNSTDIPIPDAGPWTHSDIVISGAPASATVTCIDVHYEIMHTCRSDLDVDLNDEDLSCEVPLWRGGGGQACVPNINETKTGIVTCNGESVNQIWSLWVKDRWTQDIGHIDSWWIKVYYEEPLPPCPFVDDFEGGNLNIWEITEGQEAVAIGPDPTMPSNNCLVFSPGDTTMRKPWGLLEGKAGTLSYRLMYDKQANGTVTLFFGVSDPAGTAWGNYYALAWMNSNGDPTNIPDMYVRDGGAYTGVVQADLKPLRWYDVLLDIDTASKKYDVYIDGVLVFQGAAFRSGYSPANLEYILLRTSTWNNNFTNGKVYVDDIVIGCDVVEPVEPPARGNITVTASSSAR